MQVKLPSFKGSAALQSYQRFLMRKETRFMVLLCKALRHVDTIVLSISSCFRVTQALFFMIPAVLKLGPQSSLMR